MNILITTDMNYLQHAYVMLASLLENNRNEHINLYYAHYDLDDQSLSEFSTFFQSTNLNTVFIKVDKKDLDGLFTDSYITPATYLRLCCTDLLPKQVKRILYLDPDTIVKRPLDELYEIDLGKYYIAAVEEHDLRDYGYCVLNIPKSYMYFNTGVMLIDVERFRREQIPEKLLDFSKKMGPKLSYYDQDALNATLYDRCLSLHPKWNVHTKIVDRYGFKYDSREIREAIADPAIIHFSGITKPWDYLCTSPFQKSYWYYIRKTPYKGFSPTDYSFPNVIKKYLSKFIIYGIPKNIKNLVPSGLKKRIMGLLK